MDERDLCCHWKQECPHEAIEGRFRRRDPGKKLYLAHHLPIDRVPETVVLRQSVRAHELCENPCVLQAEVHAPRTDRRVNMGRIPREVDALGRQGCANPVGDVETRSPDGGAGLLGQH